MEPSNPLQPYRDIPLPAAPAFADTQRLPRATQLTSPLAALACLSLFLPVAAGRSVAGEVLDALALEDSALPLAFVGSILAIAGWVSVTSLRAARRASPPLRTERRALGLAIVLFVPLHLVLGHALVRDATALRMTVLLPVVILPAAFAAACASWRCEGWEGWAYCLLSTALGLAGSAYTTAILTAARGDRPGVVIEAGGYAYLGTVVTLVIVAGWAVAPLAKAHDLYTYAGMAALAVALDALGMWGLALLQGVRSAADLLGPYDHRGWWESYFLVERLLATAALGLALTSAILARQRRYAAFGLVLLGVLFEIGRR